jgi:hypothetical protein
MTAPKREPDERDIDSIISALDVVPVELTHWQAAAVVEKLRAETAGRAGEIEKVLEGKRRELICN